MSLVNLQQKIGVTADGAFGPGTFKAAAAFYKLSPDRAAHFFAQTAHESGGFKAFSENLNYGAKGLRSIFRKYFPTDAMAKAYERQPQKRAFVPWRSLDPYSLPPLLRQLTEIHLHGVQLVYAIAPT